MGKDIGTLTFDTFNDLRQMSGSPSSSLRVLGKDTRNDKFGGDFFWDENSTQPDDNNNIIQKTGLLTGRWIRVENPISDESKSYTDTTVANSLVQAKSYSDSKDVIVLNNANNFATAADTAILNESKAYSDTGDSLTLATSETFATNADTTILNTSKAYTDLKTPYVTPQQFGAIGDGINDDTNAFKNAINTGISVHVPAGIYRLTDTLINTVGDFKLTGEYVVSRIQEVSPSLHRTGACFIWDGPSNKNIFSPNPDICSSILIQNINIFIKTNKTGVSAIDILGYKWRDSDGITTNAGYKGQVIISNIGLYPEPSTGGVAVQTNNNTLLSVRCDTPAQTRFLFGALFENLYAFGMQYGIHLRCVDPTSVNNPPAFFFNFINGNEFKNIMISQCWQPILMEATPRGEISHNSFIDLKVQPLVVGGITSTDGQIRTISNYCIGNQFIGGVIFDVPVGSPTVVEDLDFSSIFIGMSPQLNVANKLPASSSYQFSRGLDVQRSVAIIRDSGYASLVMGSGAYTSNPYSMVRGAVGTTFIGYINNLNGNNPVTEEPFIELARFDKATGDFYFSGNGLYSQTSGNATIFYTNVSGVKTEKMRLTNDGKLLIGVTSSAATLAVQGNGVITGNLNTTGNSLTGGTLTLYSATSDGSTVLTMPNNRSLSILDGTGVSKRMWIFSGSSILFGDIDNSITAGILKIFAKQNQQQLINNIKITDITSTGLVVTGTISITGGVNTQYLMADGSTTTAKTKSLSVTITGDGTTTTFPITHNYGATGYTVQVCPTNSAAATCFATAYYLGNKLINTTDLVFAIAPTSGSITLDIMIHKG